MKESKVNDLKYIQNMLDNIENIKSDKEKMTVLNFPLNDEMAIRLFAFSLEQIGEQVSGNRLSQKIREKYNYAWSDIIGLRNKIVHSYGKIEPAIIISVIENDIPVLEELLLRMRNDVSNVENERE